MVIKNVENIHTKGNSSKLTTSTDKNIVDMLAMPDGVDIDFDPPKLKMKITHSIFSKKSDSL